MNIPINNIYIILCAFVDKYIDALVSFCFITNHPKMHGLKQQSSISQFPLLGNSAHLGQVLWFRIFYKTAIKVMAKNVILIESSTGWMAWRPGRICFPAQSLTFTGFISLGVVEVRDSVSHWLLARGLAQLLATGVSLQGSSHNES